MGNVIPDVEQDCHEYQVLEIERINLEREAMKARRNVMSKPFGRGDLFVINYEMGGEDSQIMEPE